MRASVKLFVAIGLILGIAVNPSAQGVPKNVNDLVRSIPKLPVPQTQLTPISKETFTKNNEHGVSLSCTSEGYRKVQELDAIVALNPNLDVLWPGALVQGKSIDSGTLSPIALPRAPGVISLTSLTLEAPNHAHSEPLYSRNVAAPSQATITEAMRSMLAVAVKGNTPAHISYQFSEAYSVEQGLLDIGLSGSYLGSSASAQFHSAFSEEKTNIFVKYVQAYYSITFAPPSTPGGVFSSKVKVADAQNYIGPKNPPAFISAITYGRMVVMMVSSHSKSSELRAALDFAVRAPAGSLDVSIAAAHRSVLNNSEVRAVVIGGGAPDTVQLLTGDVVGGLGKFMAAGANFSAQSPAAPISYQARYLIDNEVARLSFTTDFKVPACVTPYYMNGGALVIENFQFIDVDDDDEDLKFWAILELLRRDGTRIDAIRVDRSDVYVLEPERDGGRSSSFFGGTSIRTQEPIFSFKVHVGVRSLDGSSDKQWGDDVRAFNAPFQDRYSYEGGGDGVWRMTVRLEK